MKKISIRLAKDKDIPEIMEIIKSAKSRLKAAGSPQWQGIYPDENSFKTDIDKNWSYLLIVDKEIAGVAALMQIPEKSYEKIENGSWLQENNLHYTTIHRIAIADQFAGRHLATIFFQLLIEESKKLGFNQVRFDTHRLNYAMQHLGEKLSFQKRGIIYVNEYQDNARISYQLIIDK
ncbi:acetyltransferase [Oenococcus oeni IOEB_8417]|uniref:GNAT family N-acetyltransferase n=1 Tax=Oenococcus oeni TaxID=1247 RepID=UPI00050EC4D2|nr:GNAT family N-acetyltransferase [Oenococcus oeni]KGH60227.1 acetyltransferase [Oenococcus oeni IOEB_9805]KGH61708.1 acetyltransferase [Oenococcus oeni S13]KGH75630.1 acetyltransferase [Oenococcus oeni IOEB_9803]KGH78916.1 acetyltransferase [Oenococcus oeni IOEB_8417]